MVSTPQETTYAEKIHTKLIEWHRLDMMDIAVNLWVARTCHHVKAVSPALTRACDALVCCLSRSVLSAAGTVLGPGSLPKRS